MSTRVEKFEQLHKSLKKHFKFNEVAVERTVLEHMLYACCLEDSRSEQADEAFAKLQQTYFDWNEVRVTTAIELSDVLSSLPNPAAAGHRIKRCLQSLFETRYQFDLEDMKKANLGKATEELQAWQGMTPFVLNYTSQHALGGHAIPIDASTVDVLWAAGFLTDAEAEKKSVTGAERAIPKNKGEEFASLLHQFAIEYSLNRKHAASLAVFKDLGVTPKVKTTAAETATEPAKSKGKDSEARKDTKFESQEKAKAAAKDTGGPATKETAPLTAASKKSQTAEAVAKETEPKASAANKKSAEIKSASKPKDAPKTSAPEKLAKAPSKTIEKADKGSVKDSEKKPATKSNKDPGKPTAARGESSKSPSNKNATAKSKPPAAKTSGGKASADKPAGDKSKGVKKPEKKAEPKKAETASKKPTKMANNVKMTKKKPK